MIKGSARMHEKNKSLEEIVSDFFRENLMKFKLTRVILLLHRNHKSVLKKELSIQEIHYTPPPPPLQPDTPNLIGSECIFPKYPYIGLLCIVLHFVKFRLYFT